MFREGERVRRVSDRAYAEANPPEDRNKPLEWQLGSHSIGFTTRNCRVLRSFDVHETEFVDDLSDMVQYAKGIEKESIYITCTIQQDKLKDYLAFLEKDDSDPDIRVIATAKGGIDVSVRASEPVTDEKRKLDKAYIGSIGRKDFEPEEDGIWLDLRMPDIQLRRLAELIENKPGIELNFNVVIRGYTWEVDDAFREWYHSQDIIIADRFNYVVLKSIGVVTSEQSIITEGDSDYSKDKIESDELPASFARKESGNEAIAIALTKLADRLSEPLNIGGESDNLSAMSMRDDGDHEAGPSNLPMLVERFSKPVSVIGRNLGWIFWALILIVAVLFFR